MNAVEYATERKTFEKYLIQHQVIRHKIIEMIRRIEATHGMIENVQVYLSEKMNKQRMVESGEYYGSYRTRGYSDIFSVSLVKSCQILWFFSVLLYIRLYYIDYPLMSSY